MDPIEETIGKSDDKNESNDLNAIKKQLKIMNDKLSNVWTKNDGSLRSIIKELLSEMKDDLLESMTRKVEVLEGRLFDKETENDQLKKDMKVVNAELENLKEENQQLRSELDRKQENYEERLNSYEQYGRRNNIRVNGIIQTNKKETAEETVKIVCEKLNAKFENLLLTEDDIDVAHRLGKLKKGKRQIIIKFKSRMKKDRILKNRKCLKGTGIFITEDLTNINNHVLQCVRFKCPDEVKSAWSIDGRILYEDTLGDIHQVRYRDFQHWIEMSWPEKKADANRSNETIDGSQ